MKKIILAAIICIVVIAGCKKDNTQLISFELAQQAGWTTESFKTNYTIQFPAGYTGQMIGFEGNTFHKAKTGDTTLFWYVYSNDLYCSDFRDTLADPETVSITVSIYPGSVPTLLSHRVALTRNNDLVGIFYYNDGNVSLGRLFWKDNGVFKEAMDVRFRPDQLSETIDIMRTIQ
jgi:hypothetical protein